MEARSVRLKPKDPNIGVEIRFTPGGHFILEVIDRSKQREELRLISQSLARPDLTVTPQAVTATYPIVFPWLCLEYPCGRKKG